MTRTQTLLGTVAALGFLGLTATANAAPAAGALGGAGAALATDAQANSVTVNVHYTCRWSHGYRRCGYVVPRVYGFYYAPPRRHFYGYGFRRHWY